MNEDVLHPRPFLAVLADAHRGRRTGRVRVTRGEGRLAVALSDGKIVGFESERLPGGANDDEDAELAALLAEAFAEGAPVPSHAAARQAILESLRARDATGVFEEGSTEGPEASLDLPLEDLLREAAHNADVLLVEESLGPLDRVLESSGAPASLTETTLTPAEGYLLSRVDGTLTALEVLDLAPLDPDAARRSLFGLLVAGLARFGSAEAKTAPFAALPPAPEPLAVDAPTSDASAVAPSSVVELPRASSLAEAARQVQHERALRERRAAIEEAFVRLQAKANHFEILGLGRGASEAEVKTAYFRLAKQFHPDTLGELTDLQEKVQAVFSRLGAAFEVLGHPKGRADYEEHLPKVALQAEPVATPRSRRSPDGASAYGPSSPEPAQGASSPHEPPRPRRSPPMVQGAPLPPKPTASDDLAWLAEEALKKSEALLSEGKFWEVIQVLETHVAALTGRARHRGRLVLAQAYLHNPKWLHRGEELLRAVVRDDPMNAEAYYLLGTIYKAGALPTRAASMFRKALEARPGHKQAAEELALLEKAPPPPRRWFRGGGAG